MNTNFHYVSNDFDCVFNYMYKIASVAQKLSVNTKMQGSSQGQSDMLQIHIVLCENQIQS